MQNININLISKNQSHVNIKYQTTNIIRINKGNILKYYTNKVDQYIKVPTINSANGMEWLIKWSKYSSWNI